MLLCPVLALSEEIDLNGVLIEIRTKLDPKHPVRVSIADEERLLGLEMKKLDPLTNEEAHLLATKLGEAYAARYFAFRKEDSYPQARERFEQDARDIFRKVFAIAIRLESLSEGIEKWFYRNQRTWHFIAEFIAIPGAVVAADYAVRSPSTLWETIGITYGVAGIIFSQVWLLPKWLSIMNTERKFSRVFESFLVAAQIPFKSGFRGTSKEMRDVGKSIGVPAGFSKCAFRLRDLPPKH